MIAYKPTRRTALRRFTTLVRRPAAALAAAVRAIAALGRPPTRPTAPVQRIPVILTTDPQYPLSYLMVAQLIGSDEASSVLLDKPYIQPARAEYPQGPPVFLHLTSHETECVVQRRPAQGFGLPGIIILFTDNPDHDIQRLTENIETFLNQPSHHRSGLFDFADFHDLSGFQDIGDLHHDIQ